MKHKPTSFTTQLARLALWLLRRIQQQPADVLQPAKTCPRSFPPQGMELR